MKRILVIFVRILHQLFPCCEKKQREQKVETAQTIYDSSLVDISDYELEDWNIRK